MEPTLSIPGLIVALITAAGALMLLCTVMLSAAMRPTIACSARDEGDFGQDGDSIGFRVVSPGP